MRFQFRIAHLFAAVTLAAIFVAIAVAVYWQVVAPRTPIAWQERNPGELATLRGGRMDVIVVASNATMTGSVHDVKFTLDVPELRLLAHRRAVAFHTCDITDESRHSAVQDMEAELGIEVFHPYVVILDGRHKPVEVVRIDGNRNRVVARIVAAK